MGQPDAARPGPRLEAPARRRLLFAARDLALGAAVAPALAVAQAPPVPPVQALHGFADQQGMTLWLQGRRAQRLRVEVRRADPSPPEPVKVHELDLDPAADATVQLRLGGLEPGTTYRYAVQDVRGETLATGGFRTQPLWQWRSDPPTLRIAAGSCAYLNDGRFDRPGKPYGGGEEIFDRIADESPDLMLWLGDNIYLREPEWTSRDGINRRYRDYREHPRLRRLLTAAPHVAIWDDHDFGPNDGDASFANAAWTREMFHRYWPLPYPAPPGGLHGQVALGDVDLFLLDDRSFRHPRRWPDGPDKALYGAAQLDWLKRALTASSAPFKLVAGGSQFFNRTSRYEGWHEFPSEQQAMRRWLDTQRVPGLVFLSGDRHFAELLRIERAGSFPLVELTTSPLTSSPVARPDEAERTNPDLVPGTFYNERNYALLTVSGPRKDRSLQIELKNTQGRTVWDWHVKASALA